MTIIPPPKNEILYFWAIGDLHFRTLPAWQDYQSRRLAPMFEDLRALWQDEVPAFCALPGDLVETGITENYQLAKTKLTELLGNVPVYPGIGNHEYYSYGSPDVTHAEIVANFRATWGYPVRYSWQTNGVVGIMLDYPDPSTLVHAEYVYLSSETLAFLDTTLAEHADQPAVIFLHCPLRNTVGDRDPELKRDYNSFQNFFSPENSHDVRTILGRHKNACLFLSGHTHSGWQAPGLVVTEDLENHPVTFVNVMSPWYTGRSKGPKISEDHQKFTYVPDDPDVIVSFAVRLSPEKAAIRVREHRTQQWLKEWIVPIQ